jgi:hypothetical protein
MTSMEDEIQRCARAAIERQAKHPEAFALGWFNHYRDEFVRGVAASVVKTRASSPRSDEGESEVSA